ncbi:histidinol-phosphatase HisJ [archaeon]|jgi:histidinol-phosphatase (PHP family)|nr:histidinol-phosphatase HisJ [archaeon]MBT3577368.1 histidinol-phosphatase HisJ [archaeon]MBT6820389.1 histidinol-phosphatase HisJ [archaeon]MBT6956235.1 histidinol-phosphatase HisJ [archaeon]MBT7025203.1 histidinol-phosphatase HisJ [archaeon]
MVKANYHTHTTGSDGKLKPEELVKLAIRKKFDILGITDHYHFPPGFRDWGNDYYSTEHFRELKRLKKKYKGKIKILVGVEFDWLKDYKSWTKKEAKKRFDYRLVSVHFVKIGKEYFPIDHSKESFEKMVKSSGGIKKLVKNYYSDLRSAIKSGWFDVVAHFDIIKVWNKNNKYFSGDEDWYMKEVRKTLKLISKKKMKLDLNASGWRRPCDEQYPSLWILREAKGLGIEILIGTDEHKAEHLEAGLARSELLLREIK